MSEPNTFVNELDALSQVLLALEHLTEEQRAFVFRSAANRFGFDVPVKTKTQTQFPGSLAKVNADSPSETKSSVAEMTPKAFIEIKDPDSDVLRVACLAYYLAFAREQPHFKPEDIIALNTEAACPSFGNPLKTVNNAMVRSRFLARAGAGKKQMSAHGESVVGALPDHAKVKAMIATYSKKKRAKSKPKKSKLAN